MSFRKGDIIMTKLRQLARYLADLTRRETSWRNSRSDPAAEFAEPKLLEIADMREDAKKVRLYDPLFDVYLDEFEDFEGEVLKS